MALSLLWVFRKHPSYPQVNLGFEYVEPEIAEIFYRDDCAQDASKTDNKQLRHYEPPLIKPKPNVKNAIRKKIVAKPGRYKRRDMRAENGDE